jgi:hypothetical protein
MYKTYFSNFNFILYAFVASIIGAFIIRFTVFYGIYDEKNKEKRND